MAMVKRIGHVAFKVTDMERSLAFYCGILDCKRAFSMDRDGEPGLNMSPWRTAVFIELFYGGTPRVEDNSDEHLTGYLHACFEVEDIFAVTEQIQKNGGTMFKEPMSVDNNYQAWIIDPDGNRIEFVQLEPDSLTVSSTFPNNHLRRPYESIVLLQAQVGKTLSLLFWGSVVVPALAFGTGIQQHPSGGNAGKAISSSFGEQSACGNTPVNKSECLSHAAKWLSLSKLKVP